MAGRQVKVLVDSGAGRNFLDAEFAERCGLRLTPNAFEVTLAGGQRSRSAGTYCGAFRLGGDGPEGIEGEVEFVVTSLRGAACDAVLGFPFLRQLNPHVDWRARTLAFGREGKGKGMGMGKGKAAGRVLLRAEGKVITVAGGYAAPLAATAAQTPIHADDKRIVDLLVGDFKDVFPDALPAGLPPSRGGIVHEIELISGARPHKQPVYRQSEVELKEMKKQLDEKLAKGFIGYSKSPYAAAAMLVPKPDGGWRFVVDYRALNKDTVKNSYALPLADELFDRVQGAQVFSKIDLRTGFYQIPLKEEDCWKTGFGTTFGHFEYRVLPMGLTNSPATFMHLMNHTFSDMTGPGGCVLVFLDDIVIYSRDREQHRKDVRAVLERLRANKLYAKMSKCSFFQREVEFLGHRLGADGVKVIQGKVEAIKQWPTPTSVKDVRSFLGLAGYYRRFVQGFGKIAAPLHELTKDDPDAAAKGKGKGKGRGDGRRKQRGHFSWGPEQQRAFDALKAALQSAPVLLIPNPKLPFVLSTDASGEAIGAVLQQDPTGHGLQPVGYYSRKLTPAERNYAVRDKELAAVIAALDHWRHLLHSGRKFVIRTDHQSLRHLMSQPRLTGRPARWLLKLEEFDFDVEYVKGPANAVADALSRNVATGAGEGRAKLSAAEMAELRSRARKAEEEGDEAVAALEARLARADSGREARRREDKSGPPARLVNVRAQLLRDEGGEERRREAEAAAQEVRPAEAYAVPPPDPDAAGNRQMATQRCAAMTRKGQGRQCRQLTRIGCLCWNHLARDAGLRVKRSTVPGAGRGLFAERDLEAGADLGVYSGLEVSGPEALRGDRSGAYALEVKRGLLIDAAPTNAAVTRFANDARGTSKRPNAAFRRNPRTGEVHLKATRRIRRGEEVLVSYGPAYWRPLAAAQRQAEVSAAQPQARARADADAAAIERPRKRKSGRGGQKARAGVFLQVRQTTAREHGRERGAREAAWRPETKYDEGAQQRRRPAELQLFALSIQGGGDDLEAAIREAGEEDDGYQELLQRPRAPVFSVERGLLYWRGRVVVPDSEELRTRVLEWCHERPEAGHLGRDKLLCRAAAPLLLEGHDSGGGQVRAQLSHLPGGQGLAAGQAGPDAVPARAGRALAVGVAGPDRPAAAHAPRPQRHRGVRGPPDEDGALRVHDDGGDGAAAGRAVPQGGGAAARLPARHRVRPRPALHRGLLGAVLEGAGRAAEHEHGLPPPDRRPDGAHQQDAGEHPARVRQLEAQRLGPAPHDGRARVQQRAAGVDALLALLPQLRARGHQAHRPGAAQHQGQGTAGRLGRGREQRGGGGQAEGAGGGAGAGAEQRGAGAAQAGAVRGPRQAAGLVRRRRLGDAVHEAPQGAGARRPGGRGQARRQVDRAVQGEGQPQRQRVHARAAQPHAHPPHRQHRPAQALLGRRRGVQEQGASGAEQAGRGLHRGQRRRGVRGGGHTRGQGQPQEAQARVARQVEGLARGGEHMGAS